MTPSLAVYVLELNARFRSVKTVEELDFILLNESKSFIDFRSAAIWRRHQGVVALSGLAIPDGNAPYVQWLNRVSLALSRGESNNPYLIKSEMLDSVDLNEWNEWFPANAIWIGLNENILNENTDDQFLSEKEIEWGLVFARDQEWGEEHHPIINEIARQWFFYRSSKTAIAAPTIKEQWIRLKSRFPSAQQVWSGIFQTLASIAKYFKHSFSSKSNFKFAIKNIYDLLKLESTIFLTSLKEWLIWGKLTLRDDGVKSFLKGIWQQLKNLWKDKKRGRWYILAFILLFPMRLTVLAQGELVPSNPIVMRAPVDGIIDRYFVTPNSLVKKGDLLAQLDLTSSQNRQKISEEELAIASAELRQSNLQSLSDSKARSLLSPLKSRVEERKAEAELASAILAKSQITAIQDGLVLFDEPTELRGKPVQAGERLLVLANPDEVEIEAWLSLNEAIALEVGDDATLYLNARPFSPVRGVIRYVGYEALKRPDGTYAYRVRISVKSKKGGRIGLKGTARLYGDYVPLSYWILRKPIAWIRYTLAI
jgi:hypothetical protein